MCLVRFAKGTAIISLYSTNWLVFMIEMVCVYCAVRTDFKIYFTLILVSMALAWLRGQLPACHRGGRVSVHTRFAEDNVEQSLFFFLRLFRFSMPISFPQHSTLIFMYMLLLPDGKTGETWETSPPPPPPPQKNKFLKNEAKEGD